MKKIISSVLLCMLILLLASCSSNTDDQYSIEENVKTESNIESNDESTESKKAQLLTKEELIEICGLSEEEYAGKDLDQFIGFFLLTKDNVNKYNIHALLADHIITNNAEDIFDGTAPIRKDNFTQDVVRIAFRENKGTTNNCSYIDVRENSIWPYEYSNLFFDLNEYESQPISNDEIDDILECFDKNGVFSMKSKAYNSNYITDPVSFTLVIEYSDGTRFVLSRSGSPEKVYPKNYDEWRDMLFR